MTASTAAAECANDDEDYADYNESDGGRAQDGLEVQVRGRGETGIAVAHKARLSHDFGSTFQHGVVTLLHNIQPNVNDDAGSDE